MKNRILCVPVLSAMLSIGALCAVGTLSTEKVLASEKSIETTDTTSKKYGKPSEEEKKQMKEKWSALSKEQKEEVYKLIEQKDVMDGQILDKLVSFGVIDKEDATQMKERRKEGLAKMKESGEFPMGPKHHASKAEKEEKTEKTN